jgi:hypothetical protein
MGQEAIVFREDLRSPRAAAIAGVIFSLLNCGCFETRSFHSSKTPGFKQSGV